MKSDPKLCILVATTAVASGNCYAGTIYVTYNPNGPFGSSVLATVDPLTGVVTDIGAIGAPNINGLAYDTSSRVLYGMGIDLNTNESSLYAIDCLSGVGNLVGSAGISGSVSGLTYEPGSSILYGTLDPILSTGSSLVVVDRNDGAISFVGSASEYAVNAIATIPNSDYLRFTGGFVESLAVFGSIDPGSGVHTFTSNNGVSITGMEFDAEAGLLYGISGVVGAPPAMGDKLFTIDPLTGEATLLVTLDRSEFYSSLAVIPVPAPGAGLALMPLAFLGARRRR